MVLALSRYMGQESYENAALVEHVAAIAPDAVQRAARCSGLVLRQSSRRWHEIAALAKSHPASFAEFANIFQIFDALETEKIQILSVVPHLLKTISDQAQKLKRKNLREFKYFMTAAAPLSGHLVRTLLEQHGFKVIQGYGLSEAVNFSLTMPIDLELQEYLYWYTFYERPSIGTPVFGNDVFILDEKLSECKEGEPGQLCLRGLNIMKEYKGQDMSETFYGEYLHTGDTGFYRIHPKSGKRFYFISGRTKDVCKRAAVTVSLVEVDDIIQKWMKPNVDVISFAFENNYVGEEIALAINSRDADIIASLSQFCREHFSVDMQPRFIIATDMTLRTESGKPLRWKFKSVLNDKKDVLAGTNIIVEHK
ncbi:MAG: long-chain fatty acid--CoA ligase [Proteobacteria bacterium]|nr:MAG: long-chain fatty acid--CoA ligase [Pseudomonadota bacterium]